MTELYLISPPKIELASFIPTLEGALKTGKVASFQLRLKDATDDEILAAGKKVREICSAHGVAYILNDRADLCVQLNADGVHLGQDDMAVKEARAIIGADRVIGVSAHASRHMAMEAGEQGADYVAFGAFYPTTSKPQEKIDKWGVPEVNILSWWSELMELPCVAIGGVNASNAGILAKAGADFVACITTVWNHPKGAVFAVEELHMAISS